MDNNKKPQTGTPVNPSQRPQAPATPTQSEQPCEGDFRNADAVEETGNNYQYEIEPEDNEADDDNKGG